MVFNGSLLPKVTYNIVMRGAGRGVHMIGGEGGTKKIRSADLIYETVLWQTEIKIRNLVYKIRR